MEQIRRRGGARGPQGPMTVPGDKSISHRAIILGALAEGVTEVSGCLRSEDCQRTLGAFRALGGDASRRRRPMDRIIRPLTQMGAEIWGRAHDTLPPLAVRGGSLRGVTYRSPVPSAQVKSAILLAGLFGEGPTTVIEPGAPGEQH